MMHLKNSEHFPVFTSLRDIFEFYYFNDDLVDSLSPLAKQYFEAMTPEAINRRSVGSFATLRGELFLKMCAFALEKQGWDLNRFPNVPLRRVMNYKMLDQQVIWAEDGRIRESQISILALDPNGELTAVKTLSNPKRELNSSQNDMAAHLQNGGSVTIAGCELSPTFKVMTPTNSGAQVRLAEPAILSLV